MKKKILILGANGMLGHALFKHFYNKPGFDTFATIRSVKNINIVFSSEEQKSITIGVDASKIDTIDAAIKAVRPDVVINCIGIIKQSSAAKNYFDSISINSLLPHQIVKICDTVNARLIHISTDCVFDGKTGNYVESDNSNATDLYGKTKYLGEVDYPNAITIRTSIIGHELDSKISLVDWFLDQADTVKGFTNAIFTGFTTYELANIIEKYVIPNTILTGLYQVSADPISKFDLLSLVAKVYAKDIKIIPFADFYLDRSLNSDKFRKATGFHPKSWPVMIEEMSDNFKSQEYYSHL